MLVSQPGHLAHKLTDDLSSCRETDIFGLYFGDDAIYIHCSSTPRKGLIRILEVADARTVARTLQSLRRYG